MVLVIPFKKVSNQVDERLTAVGLDSYQTFDYVFR